MSNALYLESFLFPCTFFTCAALRAFRSLLVFYDAQIDLLSATSNIKEKKAWKLSSVAIPQSCSLAVASHFSYSILFIHILLIFFDSVLYMLLQLQLIKLKNNGACCCVFCYILVDATHTRTHPYREHQRLLQLQKCIVRNQVAALAAAPLSFHLSLSLPLSLCMQSSYQILTTSCALVQSCLFDCQPATPTSAQLTGDFSVSYFMARSLPFSPRLYFVRAATLAFATFAVTLSLTAAAAAATYS